MKARDAVLAELPKVSTYAALIELMRKSDDVVIKKLVGPWWNESTSGSGLLSVDLGGRNKLQDLLPLVLRALEHKIITIVRIQNSGLVAADVGRLCASVRPAPHGCCESHATTRQLADTVVELDLRQNKFGDEGCGHVASLLKRRKVALVSVSLDECGITEAGLAHICKVLNEAPYALKHLSIGDNAMGSVGLKHLAAVLVGDAVRLESLRLENWDFENGGGFDLIIKALRTNKWLHTLFVSKVTTPVGDASAWTDFLLATDFEKVETALEDQLELRREVDVKTRCANPLCRATKTKTGRCGGACGGRSRYCSKACQAFDWPLHRRRDGCVNNAVTVTH